MTAERQQDWLDQLGVAFERLCSGADSPLAYHFTDCQALTSHTCPSLIRMGNLNVPNYNSVRCTSKLDNPVKNLWTSNKTLHIKLW